MAFSQPISNQLVTFLTRFQYALLEGIFLSVAIIPIALAETDCQKAPLMPVEQCETLLALYRSTNGSGWRNQEGWNTTNEPCKFALVKCSEDGNGNVIELNLHQNLLKGSLPDLSSLIHLEVLSLRNNQLEGTIPELSSLTQLETASFYENKLCGQIPDLNALTNLEQLDLSQNKLSGSIPALNELKKTSPHIALSGNQLFCRDENNDYTGFESLVDSYDDCIEDEEYPLCLKYMQLKISKEGEGTGSITGIGIDCGEDCDEQYDGNTEVTLTAIPDAGSTFKEWSGTCSGTDVCQITFDQSQEVIATFDLTLVSYALTVKLDGTGSGTVSAENIDCGSDCTEEYPENAEVILTATPETDSAFTGWDGACSGTDVCSVSMTEAQDITATFDLVSTANELTVSKNGSGVGTVRGEGINCGGDCSEQYGNNTRITLNAIPGTGATFVGWAGACFGANPSCQIIMDQTKKVTATFNSKTEPTKQYTLTVNKDGTGVGTIRGNGIDCGSDCSEQYAENTDVTLNAIAAADSAFAGWAGACSGTGVSCLVSLSQAKTVTASFSLLVPSTQTGDLAFVLLKHSYNVGEFVTVDLVEHLQVAPRSSRVDLWVAVAYPEDTFHFMTDQPLQPFSLAAQPYRRNIVSSELATTEKRYHLLYFDVPPNVGGTYDFYAIYNEAGADLSNLLFTQQSNLAFTTTVLNNNLNPSILPTPPSTLTMLVSEELELIVDSEMTFNALLSSCTMKPLDIVQSESAQSSNGSGVSCHLTALKPGSATLTTTDKNGNALETVIVVKSF
jgi:uncharacterized repeat protein (TIGR02543 family)